MTHKIYNIISILATIGLTIFSNIKGYNIIFMLGFIFLAYIIGYIIINAILKENLKAFLLYPLIGIIIFTGVSNITNVAINTFSYLTMLPENIKSINLIENDEKYTKLFSFEDTTYYIADTKDALIGINNKSKFEGSEIFEIYEESTLSDEVLEKIKLFTSLDSSDKFKNLSNYTIHYGLINDTLSEQIMIRIIDENNNIYYTYITPQNLKDFFNNNKLFKNYFSKGDFNLYFSTAIIEQEIESENNIDEINETDEFKTTTENNINEKIQPVNKVLTLSNNSYYFTDIAIVEYENKYTYKTRINNYLNKEIIEKAIQLNEKNQDNLSDEEKTKLEIEKNNLINEITNYYVYLSDEIVKSDNEIFRFLTAIDTENSEEKTLTDINIIEIEKESEYIIFKTEMEVNSLYSILYD